MYVCLFVCRSFCLCWAIIIASRASVSMWQVTNLLVLCTTPYQSCYSTSAMFVYLFVCGKGFVLFVLSLKKELYQTQFGMVRNSGMV